jgi:hypothetical protein
MNLNLNDANGRSWGWGWGWVSTENPRTLTLTPQIKRLDGIHSQCLHSLVNNHWKIFLLTRLFRFKYEEFVYNERCSEIKWVLAFSSSLSSITYEEICYYICPMDIVSAMARICGYRLWYPMWYEPIENHRLTAVRFYKNRLTAVFPIEFI